MSIDTTKKVNGISVNGTNMNFSSSIDSNILPSNIKEGVSILGVDGTFKGGALQNKTINITQNKTTIVTPDDGYYGLGQVEIITKVQGGGGTSSAIYGVSWENDGTTTMTRTDDAVEMTYAISNGKVASDFDNVFPYNEMKRTTIDGNVFVYVPAMFFRITTDENKKITAIAVSQTQGDGDDWYETRPFYYGAYGASGDGSVLKSVSGASRKYSITRANARTQAMAVGTDYHQRDLYAGTILMFLWWIEFATKNSASIMTGTQYGKTTGNTDSIYNEEEGENFCVSGYNTSTSQMVWHGIEDYIGNGLEWEDGVTGTGAKTLVVSDDYTKYNDTGADMESLSFDGIPSTSGNCLEALGWDDEHPFLVQPIATRSDSSYASGFCDYADTSSGSSYPVSYRGCSHPSFADSGVSYFNRDIVSYSISYIGCRLLLNA